MTLRQGRQSPDSAKTVALPSDMIAARPRGPRQMVQPPGGLLSTFDHPVVAVAPEMFLRAPRASPCLRKRHAIKLREAQKNCKSPKSIEAIIILALTRSAVHIHGRLCNSITRVIR
jgi:hypothetical protein